MQKPTLQMALGKAVALAANMFQRIHQKTWKSAKPKRKSVNNPLEGNPQLPQSSTRITNTFLN